MKSLLKNIIYLVAILFMLSACGDRTEPAIEIGNNLASENERSQVIEVTKAQF